uniref:Cytochrome c oxidase subunit 2 n=1 Tax=Campodea lubbockii TaxID=383858 RepID=Q0ZD03_9HEXA|nr:cytochrome c oxidase subunit II [Campodea lubbockii]ABF49577.1 cytochrome c oxidase subunit II [Campodea lubbockii]
MNTWSQLFFQDSSSPLMEQLLFFHDHTMLIIMVITMLISYMLTSVLFNSFSFRFLLEGQSIEIIWTIMPAIILIFIALPSLHLLYLLDEIYSPSLTIKTIGHQWYWSYEYSDFNKIEFDSYMIPSNEMANQMFRLLEVDNNTVIPFNTQIRILITAADVLHSWAMPSMGIKADATPGRLNQSNLFSTRPGLFYGQCSEICGANHSFMPITLESISSLFFSKWIMKNL